MPAFCGLCDLKLSSVSISLKLTLQNSHPGSDNQQGDLQCNSFYDLEHVYSQGCLPVSLQVQVCNDQLTKGSLECGGCHSQRPKVLQQFVHERDSHTSAAFLALMG